jgi:hypothetical protein
MSDSPYGGMPAGPTPYLPQGTLPSNGPSRVPVIVAIVVALLALALAAASWFRPTHEETPATPQYSEQQIADAKKNLCAAYNTMYPAIKSAGSLSSEDPNQKFMISINTRLAFNSSADYLLAAVSQNPAGPSHLLDATRGLAISYQQIILAQTATAPQEQLKPMYEKADGNVNSIKQECE